MAKPQYEIECIIKGDTYTLKASDRDTAIAIAIREARIQIQNNPTIRVFRQHTLTFNPTWIVKERC